MIRAATPRLIVGAFAVIGTLVLNTHTITAQANVPPEVDEEVIDPTGPGGDNNGTAKGTGTGTPLTPDGNGTEVDSVDDNGKYFYTFSTDQGNYFYIVVDETREDKNVYVLSAVSEEELLTLCGEEGEEEGTSVVASTTKSDNSDLFGTPGGAPKNDGKDNDGNGILDSWDMNGDGVSDAFDTDGDGIPDSFDTNGDGVPDLSITGPDVTRFDVDGDGIIDAWDTNGDEIIDAYDSDGDGIPDLFKADAAKAAGNAKEEADKAGTKNNSKLKTDDAPVKSNELFVIVAILLFAGVLFYFKIYRPKRGYGGSGSSDEFEDDPDFEDEEDDDNIYEFSSNYSRSSRQSSAVEDEDEPDNGSDEEDKPESEDGDYEKRREEGRREAEALKRQLSELYSNTDQKINQQSEVIRSLEEENTNLKETVSKTRDILTGTEVPEEEYEEDSEEDD